VVAPDSGWPGIVSNPAREGFDGSAGEGFGSENSGGEGSRKGGCSSRKRKNKRVTVSAVVKKTNCRHPGFRWAFCGCARDWWRGREAVRSPGKTACCGCGVVGLNNCRGMNSEEKQWIAVMGERGEWDDCRGQKGARFAGVGGVV